MIGLFGALNLAQQSLSASRQGVEVAGQNLANVNNPAYARQRLQVTTAPSLVEPGLVQGTGVQVVGIKQLRDQFVDEQIQDEASITGFLEAQQRILEYAQANLGQQIDRKANSAEGASAAQSAGGQLGLSETLANFFNAFHAVSANVQDTSERLTLLQRGQSLAAQLRTAHDRMSRLQEGIDTTLRQETASANTVLATLAHLNERISLSERYAGTVANDLRDARTQKLEELAKFAKFDVGEGPNGSLTLSVGGVTLVHGKEVVDTLELYDAGGGQMLLRARTSGTPLALTGGSLQGNIEARDGDLRRLQTGIHALAANLITELNALHATGYGLDSSSGEVLFTGTDARDIAINSVLLAEPRKFQAARLPGAKGDNAIAVAMARLADQPILGLQQQTFGQAYSDVVANLGQALYQVKQHIGDQQLVNAMLQRERDAISGVSLDEEMTDLLKYQRAFQASARLINAVDQMIQDVVQMAR